MSPLGVVPTPHPFNPTCDSVAKSLCSPLYDTMSLVCKAYHKGRMTCSLGFSVVLRVPQARARLPLRATQLSPHAPQRYPGPHAHSHLRTHSKPYSVNVPHAQHSRKRTSCSAGRSRERQYVREWQAVYPCLPFDKGLVTS